MYSARDTHESPSVLNILNKFACTVIIWHDMGTPTITWCQWFLEFVVYAQQYISGQVDMVIWRGHSSSHTARCIIICSHVSGCIFANTGPNQETFSALETWQREDSNTGTFASDAPIRAHAAHPTLLAYVLFIFWSCSFTSWARCNVCLAQNP